MTAELPGEDEARALAARFNLPFVEVARAAVQPDAVARLSIAYLAENQVLPLARENGVLPVAIGDVTALGRVDEVALILDCAVRPVLAEPRKLAEAIAAVAQGGGDSAQRVMDGLGGGEAAGVATDAAEDIANLANEAPVIKMVNLLLLEGINDGASDVHVEPYEVDLVVRYRIDGILHEGPKPPPRYRLAIISRLKIMAKLDIAERRLPQDGRIKLKMLDREYDIRLSTLPGLYGESVVMRVLDQSKILYDLKDIGFQPRMLEQFCGLLEMENGIVLVTGPTGSGKTTTLYAGLNRLNQPDVKIITVEDPVEYRLRGLVQIQANAAIGLTFAAALRSILRQDPDVVMIGEMRDLETASIGIQAALTGHLVLSTLHTNDAPTAVTRLTDMGVPAYLIASVLRGVLAQRLARQICGHCREAYTPDPRELIQLWGHEPPPEGALARGRGCDECRGSGYRGRLGIYELLVPDEAVRALILKGSPSGVIKDEAKKSGMVTLHMDALDKVRAGLTTVAEALRTTQSDD